MSSKTTREVGAQASLNSRRRKIRFALALGAVLAGLLFFVLWLTTSGSLGPDAAEDNSAGAATPEHSALAAAPTAPSMAAWNPGAGTPRLLPLQGASGFVTARGDEVILRVSTSHEDALIGLPAPGKADADTSPGWVVPLPEDAGNCSLATDQLDCGAASVTSLPGDYADQTFEPLAPLPFGAPLSEGSAPLLASSADQVTTSDGSPVLVGTDDVWVAASEGAHLIFNGSAIAAVEDEEVTWTHQLPAGSAEVNAVSTDTPAWAVSGGSVLVGSPGGLTAFKVADGAELWSVKAPVASFRATERYLALTTTDNAVVVLALAGGDIPAETTATVMDLTGDLENLAPPLTEADVMNAAVEVPESCASHATQASVPARLQFESGEAKLDDGHPDAGVFMADVQEATLDGAQHFVVGFDCHLATRNLTQVVAVYDHDLNLVQDISPYAGVEASPYTGPSLTGVEVAGNDLTVTTEGWASIGTELCTACYGTLGARANYVWLDGEYQLDKVGYVAPHEIVAAPDQKAVQALYDDIAAGRDSAASGYLWEAAADLVASDDLDVEGGVNVPAGFSYRKMVFHPSGKVLGCQAMPPDASLLDIPGVDPSTFPYSPPENASVGDFICVIGSKFEHEPGDGYVYTWWAIRGGPTPDEFGVYAINRAFN